jgi:hypothetical protein
VTVPFAEQLVVPVQDVLASVTAGQVPLPDGEGVPVPLVTLQLFAYAAL